LVPGAGYDDEADKGLLVVVQIESRPGVENVEEIAKVEGVDVLFIGMKHQASPEIYEQTTYTAAAGPFDLAKMMGVVRGGDEHEAAIQRVLKAAKDAGKKAAIFCEFPTMATYSCHVDVADGRLHKQALVLQTHASERNKVSTWCP
jgi:4-hydroxy-2-oxoheptanedioate aldolase